MSDNKSNHNTSNKLAFNDEEINEIRYIISIYLVPNSNNIYCIKPVICSEWAMEYESCLDDMKVTDKYYIYPIKRTCEAVCKIIYESLFTYAVKEYQCFHIDDFNNIMHEVLVKINATDMPIIFINNIFDTEETLKAKFIKRLHDMNIYNKYSYYKQITNHNLEYPLRPDLIFTEFKWCQVDKDYDADEPFIKRWPADHWYKQ